MGFQATGRETFLLPMKWTDDGWPQILPAGVRVPYTLPAPAVPGVDRAELPASPQPATAPVPLSGNFTWRDEFDSGAERLAPLWLMLRAPKEKWWSLTDPKGVLSLTPRTDTLAGLGNPAFFGRRVQHAKFSAGLALVPGAESNVSAGLALFQNEAHFYYLGARRTAKGLALFLELADGGKPAIVARADLPAAAEVELRIVGDELSGTFEYRVAGGTWQTLLDGADLKPITTNAAGGGMHFTGAVVGPHARIDPPP